MTLELPFNEFIVDFFTAAGVGALIGLEREHRRDSTQVVAGVRTFPLVSLTGYMLAIIAQAAQEPMILAASTLVIGAIAIAFLLVRHQLGVTGLTTPIAMLVTFLIGVLVGYEFAMPAIIIGVATTLLLLTKERLHRFAEVLSDDEIMSALQFVTLVFILFPLLSGLRAPVLGQPWLGRGALVDPFAILLIVIFVSSISFASFIAMRTVGTRRGIALSGLLGGLVNSEATTVSLAEHYRANQNLLHPAILGSVLATTTMVARNLAIAAFADPRLSVFTYMLFAAVPLMLAGAVFAYRQARKGGVRSEQPVRVKTPFAIGPAVRFAIFFALLSLFASLASEYLGTAGVYITAIGGFVSAGAVVASVTTLFVQGHVQLHVAVITAALGTLAAVANKIVIFRWADERLLRAAARPYAIMLALGFAGLIGYVVWSARAGIA